MEDILDHEYTAGDFEYFREFLSVEEARDLAAILEQHNILYKLEEPQVLIDEAIVGRTILPKVILKILPRDFERVNKILAEIVESQAIPEEHYLLEFTDLELFDILKTPDNWTIEDVTTAKKILIQRGFEITDEQVKKLQEQRYDELKAGKKGSWQWIFFYGICILLGVVILHPLFLIAGVGMGLYYWQDKSRDPQGRAYYTFEENTRRLGQLIFYAGAVLMVVLFGLLFYNANMGQWSGLF